MKPDLIPWLLPVIIEENLKIVNQYRHCSNQDSNRAPLKYNSETILSQLIQCVCVVDMVST